MGTSKPGYMRACGLCPWKAVAEWAMLPREDHSKVLEFMNFLLKEKEEPKKEERR